MASNNLFSVGRDCQLVLIGPSGRVDLTHVTGFDARQLTQEIRVTRLDGTNLGTNLPRGWEGEFEIERGSSAAEDLSIKLNRITTPAARCSFRHYISISMRPMDLFLRGNIRAWFCVWLRREFGKATTG